MHSAPPPPARPALAVLAAAALLVVGTAGAALARPVAGAEAGPLDPAPALARAADVPAGGADSGAGSGARSDARRGVGESVVCDVLDTLPLCTHGDDARLAPAAAADSGASASSGTSSRIGCYRSGPRVQAVYARPAGAQDRFSASLPGFRAWAGAVDKAVDDSARKTGGSRHVRWASVPSGSSCTLSVRRVALPAEAFGTFSATIRALQDLGLDEQHVKYLVWSDAAGYCGIATTYLDDAPGQSNLNNGRYPAYARIDRRCWGHAETHELMHMLGAVQQRAPHATDGLHCSDGRDVMCYDDGTRGSRQVSACNAAHARLLDCRGDDYFSTAPAPGSWLAGHWNTAASAFLARGWTDPAPAPAPTSSPRPAPTASPTPAPRPTTRPGLGPVGVPRLPVPLPVPLPVTTPLLP